MVHMNHERYQAPMAVVPDTRITLHVAPARGGLRHRTLGLLLGTSLLLGACGGGGGDSEPLSSDGREVTTAAEALSPQKSRHTLTDFLYARSTAQVRYWASWSEVPAQYAYLQERMGGLPTREAGVTTGLFSITYASNNLPQLSLHIRRVGNSRLLVYNHGHGGVPSESETFASEFLSQALANGYDLLVTSLPLVGLNAIPAAPEEPLFITTRDRVGPVSIDVTLLTEFSSQHAVYEVIDDRDHYMHFFIDGAVIPAGLAAPSAAAGELAKRAQQLLPYTGPQYAQVDYVGLSGGATSGLLACAVHVFDNCILVAGVMPDYLRVSGYSNFGDAEQQSRSFYERFTVPDLLAISAGGTRKLTLVYNRRDTCCFADPAASRFQADFPGYDIRITELAFHGYLVNDLLAMLHE